MLLEDDISATSAANCLQCGLLCSYIWVVFIVNNDIFAIYVVVLMSMPTNCTNIQPLSRYHPLASNHRHYPFLSQTQSQNNLFHVIYLDRTLSP